MTPDEQRMWEELEVLLKRQTAPRLLENYCAYGAFWRLGIGWVRAEPCSRLRATRNRFARWCVRHVLQPLHDWTHRHGVEYDDE